MNEQDIINRLTRIEKALEDIAARLPTAQVYQTHIVKPLWPWANPGAIGSSVMPCDAPGANGAAETNDPTAK